MHEWGTKGGGEQGGGTYVFLRVTKQSADVNLSKCIACVTRQLAAQMEEDLFQMMAGAVSVLAAAGCALVGGHTGEGPQAALGFTITGIARPSALLRKSGLQ